MANEKTTKELERELLEAQIASNKIYEQAMQVWINNNSGGVQTQDSSNPSNPPPNPPGGGHP